MSSQANAFVHKNTTASIHDQLAFYYGGVDHHSSFVRTGDYFRNYVFRCCMSKGCTKVLYDDYEWQTLVERAAKEDDSLLGLNNHFTKPKHCFECATKLDKIRRSYQPNLVFFDTAEHQVLRRVYQQFQWR